MSIEKFESFSYALMARDFWQLVANSCEELSKRGNPNSLMYEGWHWPSEEEWKEHTKWSDINIAQPVLFNFYHGIELSLKALLSAKGMQPPQKHTLSSLFQLVIENYPDQRVDRFYSKYVIDDKLPEILSRFCLESGVSIDLYYQSLKYPTSTKGLDFKHAELRYNGEDGVTFFSAIKIDCEKFSEVLKELVEN